MRHTYYFYLLISTLFLSGCVTTRLVKEGEYLLDKQQIKGTQKVSKQALAQYYQQQPNSKWLGVPFLLWMYQTGQRGFDKAAIQQRMAQIKADADGKIAAAGDEREVQRLQQKRDKKIQAREKLLQEGSPLMRWGEPPVLYSPPKKALTEKNLLAYLQSKGYFDAQVSSAVKLHGQKATVTYQIKENQPYRIGELRLNTPDQAIAKLLQAHQKQSLLKQGAPYDQEVLCQERERIYELLSNHGYFSFDRQYIRFDVDTTAVDNSVVIETVIGPPAGSQAHPVFHIDQVVWDVDANQAQEVPQEQPTTYGGITFRYLSPHFTPSVLASQLGLHPPQLYRKQDLVEVQQRLARLGMFKYINITYAMAANGSLVPHIHTHPSERFQLFNELGLQVSHGLPKPFYKLSLASKNLFGRLETLTLATHIGVEGMAATTDEKSIASSQAFGIDLSLAWPQFLLPLKDTTLAHLAHLNPTTKLSVGYDFIQRPDYTQNTFKSFLRYDWQDHDQGAYKWIPFRIDVIDTRKMEERFKARLEALRQQGNNLYRVFEPSWVSLFSFRSIFCAKPTADTDRSYSSLELFFESGGTLQNFIDLRKVMPRLEYYKYVKLALIYSQHIPIRSSTVFAYRINTGIANPYGEYKILPYNRYYFLGGSNDMRAWASRSLGPGTYSPPQKASDKYHPEQPGELLLQGSVELRQQLLGCLEGALFVDAGNTWTLRDDGRPGGKFSFQDFHQAIAVGTGVGVRLNFSFLILRLDVGLKLYDPALPPGERFIGHKLALNKHLGLPGQAAFNIGIGYPF